MHINIYNWLLVFMRLSAFLLVLPFFSATNFPVTMRVAVGALGALLLAPILPPFQLSGTGFIPLLLVMIKEVSIGLLLGFLARMIFYAVDLAGTIIATEMGLNMASVLDPISGGSSPIPGTILFYLATLVMLTLNLHQWILLAFARSYALLPLGSGQLNHSLFAYIVAQSSGIFLVALEIAAPVIAVSFVIMMVFAVLGRAVPQMNVFAESFSFRVVGGLIVFGFTLQLASQHVANYLSRLPNDFLTVAKMLGGVR